jgi:dUTP pyrophosphatase
MKAVSLKIKKLSDKAVTPRYAKSGDAGLDLVATSMTETDMFIEYGTDLSMEIPLGYVGHIYPRSSLSNYDLVLSNHVGVIDSGYRGEIKFRFKKTDYVRATKFYKVGDKIGQLIVMPYPTVLIEEVTELEDSDRGFGGFGSSGK